MINDAEDVTTSEDRQSLGTAILTAVVTAGVLPFVQEMMKKAAEDSYTALRSWLKRKFHDARGEEEAPVDPSTRNLLVVKDPDTQRSLIVEPGMSSDAIVALGELDLEKLFRDAGNGKVAVYYDRATGRWRAEGS
ncbi:hypothetical protein ACH347_26365 [Saccharopolyspora sp. 5N102]|uniref:hypothetical protein n=1 Tax=Saccharopolyspora sp. 5N102 TaxID=3375155 RepID=UPI0037951761